MGGDLFFLNYRPSDTLIKGRRRVLLLGKGQGQKPGSATRLNTCFFKKGLTLDCAESRLESRAIFGITQPTLYSQ